MNSKRLAALALGIFFSLSACMRIDDGIGAVLIVESLQNFGTIGVGETKNISYLIRNSGEFKATAFSIPTISAPFSLVSTTCSTSLEVGESCDLTVAFSPTSPGEVVQSVLVEFNDGAEVRRYEFSLVGTGTAGAALSIGESSPVDMGIAFFGIAKTRDITLTNNGAGAATSLNVTISGSGFSITGNTCGSSLAAGSSCTFTVRLFSMTIGPATGQVTASAASTTSLLVDITVSVAGT